MKLLLMNGGSVEVEREDRTALKMQIKSKAEGGNFLHVFMAREEAEALIAGMKSLVRELK